MKNIKKLVGFRTNKSWKKILACLYYFLCFIVIISYASEVPKVQADIYDLFIFKTSNILTALSFFIPMLFISDFKFKDKIPILNKKKIWSDIIGFIIIFFVVMSSSELVSLLHSNDYWERYNDYTQTEIIYKEHDPDFIPEEEKSTLTEDELKEDLENITDDKKQEQEESTDNKDNNNNNNNNDSISNNDNSKPNDNNNEVINNNDNTSIQSSLMKVHYIDVGQGDSIFIELPNQQTMLIDAGISSKGTLISNYISSLGYSQINYLVGTHPHADHIGGMAHIINSFNVGNIYMPKAVSTSKTYENLLNTISQKGLKVITAKSGVNIINNGNLNINIIAPNRDYSDLNNYSAVIKITYGNRKFLFMGDAETQSENDITSDVSADVIKIGHHGSDTSSGQSFVNKVNPKYVIIMVGANNQYDHPYQITLDRWSNTGAKIYRTDLNGTIIVSTDGNSLNINSSR